MGSGVMAGATSRREFPERLAFHDPAASSQHRTCLILLINSRIRLTLTPQ
jgi:hypothetical protein